MKWTNTRKNLLVVLALLLTLALPAAACAFTDVPEDSPYAESIEYVQNCGYMIGTSSDLFSPEGSFTRAQMATVLYRLAGEPEVTGDDSFTDTDSETWYSNAVLWASREGIVNGYGGGLFGTNDPVTQEQLLTLLWRQAGRPEASSDEANAVSIFSDVSDYAKDAVSWAAGTILDNTPFSFSPSAGALRAEVAYLTAAYDRYLKNGENNDGKELSLKLTIGGKAVEVEWEDNASVDAIKELVKEKPLRFSTSEYGGFEQVGSLGKSITSNDVPITANPGDIMLYQGNNISLFYGSNYYRYTKLGKIKGLRTQQLEELLGGRSAVIVLSLE